MLDKVKNENKFHQQILNQKSNKNIEITVESGEFFEYFNYFIVVQFNGKLYRTNVSEITRKPLFKGNKFYFPFQEYDLLISQTIAFRAFIIVEKDEGLNNKLLGENIFELSSLGDFTKDLNTPIMRKIELYQKFGDRKSSIGKITVKLRLLFDEKEDKKEDEKEEIEQEDNEQEEIGLEEIEQEDNEQEEIGLEETEQEENEKDILLNKLNFIKKHILDFLNIKLNVNITGKEKNLDLNNKNIGNFELMLIVEIVSDDIEGINLSHNNISDVRPLTKLKNIKRIDLSFNKLKDFPFNSIKSLKNLPLKKNISINLDNNGLIEKEINEINDIIIKGYETSLNSDSYKDDIKNKLINKLNQLEQKILSYFNNKLNVELTGKELKIDLNNKNIENIDLYLLSSVDFNNLEEINLANNKISNIKPLKNFKNLKKINLAYNEINKLDELKIISEKNNKIETLNLNDNMIEDVEILKQNIFPNIIEINLDNNNIIKKEIEEIKMMIEKNKNKKNKIECIINYYVNEDNTQIRLFGEEFIKKNLDNYEIKFNRESIKIKEHFLVKEKGYFKIKLNQIKTVSDMSYMFYECSSLLSLSNMEKLKTKYVKNMSYMFYKCDSLSSLSNIDQWDTNNVENMSYMFYKCKSLSSLSNIGNWDTKNAKNTSYMFYGCSSLSSLSNIGNWDTNNITDMNHMFSGCSSLTSLLNIGNWDTKNAKNMSYMFSGCSSLLSLSNIENWATNNVKDMSSLFYGCTSLKSLSNIGNWDTKNVETMSYMFSRCNSLKSLSNIGNWNTNKVTFMSHMFEGCSSLTSLSNIEKWNTHKSNFISIPISNIR